MHCTECSPLLSFATPEHVAHGFVVKGVAYTPSALDWAAGVPLVGLAVVTAAAVAVALLLAAPPVARGLRPAIDPLGTIDELDPRGWAGAIPPHLHASAAPVGPHFLGQLR